MSPNVSESVYINIGVLDKVLPPTEPSKKISVFWFNIIGTRRSLVVKFLFTKLNSVAPRVKFSDMELSLGTTDCLKLN